MSEPPAQKVTEASASPTGQPESEEKLQASSALKGIALKQALDAEIEAELAAALGDMDAATLLGPLEGTSRKVPTGGKGSQNAPGHRKGTVVAIGRDGVFVDVGGRSQGVLPLEQFHEGPPSVGAELEVNIEGYDPENGLLILNRKGAVQTVDWSTVAEGMVVEARVTGSNKAGLEVDVNGIRGFMPISQIELFRVEDLGPYLNQRLLCIVTEASPAERNLVVSRRALLAQEREEQKQKLLTELAPGQIRSGVVRTIKPFGAFIDLGGVDGLLPASEISWARVEKPEDLLQVGQRVDVQVVRIDPQTHKITLSMKQLQTSPWEAAADRYAVGATVSGIVTRITEYGAFVQIEPGLEGLIHISELSTKRVGKVTEVLKAGQQVMVQVLKFEPAQRRLSLSLKALQRQAEEAAKAVQEAAAAAAEEAAPPRKPVRRLTNLKGGLGSGGGSGGLFGGPKPN
jgi:small subunit ribosomal protein S1